MADPDSGRRRISGPHGSRRLSMIGSQPVKAQASSMAYMVVNAPLRRAGTDAAGSLQTLPNTAWMAARDSRRSRSKLQSV